MVCNDGPTTFGQASTFEAANDTHQLLSNLHKEQKLFQADCVHRDQNLQTSDHTCNICPKDYCEISRAQGKVSNIFQMLTYENFQRAKLLSSFYGLKCHIIGVWDEEDDTCASNSKGKLKGLLLKIGLCGLLRLMFPGKSAIIFPELPELTASMEMYVCIYWHVSYAIRGVQEKLKYLKVIYCQEVKIQSQKAGKIAHSKTSDAAQKKVMRKNNSVASTEKDFRKIDMNSCSLNTWTSKNDKNKMIGIEQNNSINEQPEKAGLNEQINLGSNDENGNENLIAAYYTPDKARRIPYTGHRSDRAVFPSVGLKGDTEEIPERNESDKHSDKSVPGGDNKDASAALPPHTQETESCRTPDSSRTQGIQEVPEDVSGRDNREATEKAESYDKTDQECVEGDTNDCCSESCSEDTGANGAEVGTQQSLQTAGTDSPNFLIDEEDEGKTPKSFRSVVSFSDDNSLNSSELNTPDTEAGTTDIVQSISQADAEAQSTENGSENESVGESDQVKTDQSKDADDPCPEDTSLSESVTHRTDAGERTMSSETFSSNNDSPPNLMCEVEDCVIDVKKQLSGVLHTAPIDRGLLEGKKQSPSSQPGVPCPPTLNEQKLAPRVQSFPGQQTPGLDSPLGASQRPAEQERLELDKERSLHWTLHRFRPRDSVRSRPRHSDQAGTQTQTIPADLRQRMRQRNYRIASMLHLVSSLPVGVVELADAGLYYDEDTDEICCYKCSWRISRRGFCDVQDLANTHLCSLNTGGDVTTSQGREADREDDQTARTSEADRDVARQDCLQRGSACSEPKPVTGHSMPAVDTCFIGSSALAHVSLEEDASTETAETSELPSFCEHTTCEDSRFCINAFSEVQTRASHTGDTSHPITCASGVTSTEQVVTTANHQPAEDDDSISSFDVDYHESRTTSQSDSDTASLETESSGDEFSY
ncbi:uro-adherence factor A-like [Littorina saxatilis]|uniref:uro-adherence factor A-like n=1 Tax=Littorina saxatilis TaxID=31220 RepID=UPI0038B64B4B